MTSAKANLNYRRLRRRLLSRGTNLKRFAEKHRLPLSTVYHAAMGKRFGVESARILRQLEEAANA